jgi:DNA-directed RNA polymerase specialized sigma subunit
LYEWLLDYQKLKNEIDYLEYKIEREKRELRRWIQGDLQNVKLKKDSIASKLEERIAAYEKEIEHKKADLHKAEELISQFKGLENKILYYKYVKGMTLSEVADTLGYSGQYIYNKHAEIMKRINFAHQLNINLT